MPEPAEFRGTLLGFDYGMRRIGVAVGQFATRTASPLQTVAHRDAPDWDALDRLIREWRPNALVVGLPLNDKGEETDLSRAARRFGGALAKRYGLPCRFADERLTSKAAEAQFAEMRARGSARRKHAQRLDAMAAQIILENWLQSAPDGAPPATAADA
ncbi:Holliday junction resolvase RuvX [Elongatibacter sediminis]|uniref:Putative pre-16S rRNA nuclease n=1 Tax=Elongatibacter sediminis TaxID=3119006 RepID=A0AAW9RCI2_9GAMM